MIPTISGLVSVIVPCFNQGHFLPDAIESLRKQTYERWECIIINDGSTDNTDSMATELARQDPRIRYLAQSNRGLPRTRNRGLDEARGSFIQFLDADDVILPLKLQLQLEALSQRTDPGIAYCPFRFGSSDDVYVEPPSLKPQTSRLDDGRELEQFAGDWETRISIPIHCYLFDARLVATSNLRFDPSLPTHEDWDFVMTLLSLKPRLAYVPEPLAIYRMNAASMCNNRRRMRRGFLLAIKKQRRLLRHERAISELLRKKLRVTRTFYRTNAPLYELRTLFDRALKRVLRTAGKAFRSALHILRDA